MIDVTALPRVHGEPLGRGLIRSEPEDFDVDEILGFEPAGTGAHWYLRIEKKGATTRWIATRLARLAGCHARDVGYSGLKDRHAVTRQWFSVPAAHQSALPDAVFESREFRVLKTSRNPKKLRRGTHRANRFQLRIRHFDCDAAALQARLHEVRTRGVPNFFGPQRFGHQGDNLRSALELFAGTRLPRRERSFALSAARSQLFNRILALRVRRGLWSSLVPGDHANLDGRGSVFEMAAPDRELSARCTRGEIHPCGTLWGREGSLATGEARALELEAVAGVPELTSGLCAAGLRSRHRALRLWVHDFEFEFSRPVLELRFTLSAGAFATAVLHEILDASPDIAPGAA